MRRGLRCRGGLTFAAGRTRWVVEVFCVLFSMIAKIAARTGFKLLTPQLVFGSGDRRVISPLRFGEQA